MCGGVIAKREQMLPKHEIVPQRFPVATKNSATSPKIPVVLLKDASIPMLTGVTSQPVAADSVPKCSCALRAFSSKILPKLYEGRL